MRNPILRITRLSLASRVLCLISSCLLLQLVAHRHVPLAVAQGPVSGRGPGEEIPWRDDLGGGRLTDPGTSRVLPPPVDSSDQTRLVSGETSDPSVRTASRSMRNGEVGEAVDDRWWNEDAERSIGNAGRRDPGRGVSPRGEILLSTQILAWVGNEPILAGDLLGRINEALEPAIGKVPETELEQQRWMLMEQLLPAAIESKMVYLDFTRNLEREQIQAIRSGIYKQFDDKQLPQLVEQAKMKNATELEMRMRSYGSSLENVRRTFYEQVAAREMIRRKSGDDSEVTHDELLEYYTANRAEYAFEAKARWEHLMARFSRFPSRREAYDAVRDMGNSVLLGAKLDTVARSQSHGPTASAGGQYDWTSRGSLVSTVLDDAIFSTQVGDLSDVLMDDDGFHIVRVLERKDAGHVSFVEAQVGIRDKIKQQRRDDKVREYLERLKRETYVWNYFVDGASQQ